MTKQSLRERTAAAIRAVSAIIERAGERAQDERYLDEERAAEDREWRQRRARDPYVDEDDREPRIVRAERAVADKLAELDLEAEGDWWGEDGEEDTVADAPASPDPETAVGWSDVMSAEAAGEAAGIDPHELRAAVEEGAKLYDGTGDDE